MREKIQEIRRKLEQKSGEKCLTKQKFKCFAKKMNKKKGKIWEMFGRNAEQVFLDDMFQISLRMGGLCIPEAGLSVRATRKKTESATEIQRARERER
jgi:hypothetical protein